MFLCNRSSVRDFAERLSVNFNLEIRSNHFGNSKSLSIEVCDLESIDEDYNAQSEFYSHLSDNVHQDVSTTYVFMIYVLNELKKGKNLNPKYTI